MKTLLLLSVIALCGCSRIHQHLTSTVWHVNGDIEKKETCCKAYVSGDTKEALEKLRVSNGKTHSIGLSGLQNESSLDNTAAIVHDGASILASSLLKVFIPGL